jgi:hypothetical protein
VQQQHRLAIGGPCFGIADIEQGGIDLLQRSKGGMASRHSGLRRRSRFEGRFQDELSGGNAHGGRPDEPAAAMIDWVRHSRTPVAIWSIRWSIVDGNMAAFSIDPTVV